MRLLGLTCLFVLLAACGPDEPDPNTTQVKPVVGPKEAVQEVRLQLEQFLPYRYCSQTYPRVCDDLPVAYVLPREGTEDYRIVFFNNQNLNSTPAIFDYVTYNPEKNVPDVVGQFEWVSKAGQIERKGKPLWDIPE